MKKTAGESGTRQPFPYEAAKLPLRHACEHTGDRYLVGAAAGRGKEGGSILFAAIRFQRHPSLLYLRQTRARGETARAGACAALRHPRGTSL